MNLFFILIPALILLLLCAFFYLQNNRIQISLILYRNKKIPAEFRGMRILHVSDLHNKRFGKGQKYLLQKTAEAKPDIIVISGDLIYRRKVRIDIAMEYIKQASTIAPVYFTPGNHELKIKDYGALKKALVTCGVHVLEDRGELYQKGGALIHIAGITDPKVASRRQGKINPDAFLKVSHTLERLTSEKQDLFTIFLSHRPDLFSLYEKAGCDLVFCGHAHGGQIRLPLVGGLYAPDQGIFPKYTCGAYQKGNTTMIVSRGLGQSLFPLRIFNRPHLIVVTLQDEQN